MKSQILAIVALLPAPLLAAAPFEIELIAPPKQPVVVKQEQLDTAATLAKAAREKAALMKRKLDKAAFEKLRKLEATLAKGNSLKQGISLKLRFTNTGDKPLRLQYGPDTSTNFLTVEGPKAIDLPFFGAMTLEFRQPKPTIIEPGKSKEFPIEELRYGSRDMSRWIVGKPGTYTVKLRFVTQIGGEKVELTTNKVTVEVRAEK